MAEEFVNENVTNFLQSEDITPEKSAPYAHCQNSTAENAMKTLKIRSRILLDEFGHFDKRALKGESLKAAAFLHNRTPNSQLQNKTPAEVLGIPKFDLPLYPWNSRVYALNKHKTSDEDQNSVFS